MNLPVRLTSKVSVQLGGQSWPVLFSHRALLDVESVTGLDILAGEYKVLALSAKALRATVHTLVAVSVLPAVSPLSEPDVGRLLGSLKVLSKVRESVVAAWRAAMPEPEPETKNKAKTRDFDSGREAQSKHRTWLEVWANNRETLRLTDDQWLSYTPRMVQQLARERLELTRYWELQISRVGAATVNFSMCHPKNPVADGHFMVHPWDKAQSKGSGDLLRDLSAMEQVFPLAAKLAKEKQDKAGAKI